MVNKDLHYL